ncbi:MAG: DUF3253 domain-containing protein [Sulfitobacter sp.]|nr:DUF3253 domain-containing protein [Sulfitobacter sp.]
MKLSRKRIEAEITAQLDARGRGKTICPSDVARALMEDWRPLMEEVRAVADEMAGRGEIRVTQKGDEVRATEAKGPIRLGLPDQQESD